MQNAAMHAIHHLYRLVATKSITRTLRVMLDELAVLINAWQAD
jgi:hypothetical protein